MRFYCVVLLFLLPDAGTPFQLIDVQVHHTEYGLSHYAATPSEAADSLRPLLDEAIKLVPPHDRPNTPLILRATAGLRLLPDSTADRILDEVGWLALAVDSISAPRPSYL